MVVNPLLGGLLGLQADAANCHLVFAPHVPAEWNTFSVNNVRVGSTALDLDYRRTIDSIELEVRSTGAGSEQCSVEFSPAVSLRARVTRVLLNGHALPLRVQENSADQHVAVNLPVAGGRNTIEIQMKDDFELSEPAMIPTLGSTSHGLRVLSESWSPTRDSLSVLLSGAAGEIYELTAWNPGQVRSVEGAELEKGAAQQAQAKIRVQLPASTVGVDPQATIIFHFAAR
jgi:hypothetical protein